MRAGAITILQDPNDQTHLFHECTKFTEFLQDRLVGNGSNVLNVVEGLAFLVARSLPSRFSRVNTLQDTEATKVLDRNLQHF